MRANFLKYIWKGMSGYSYAYVLITDKYSIDDIIEIQKKKKIVLFGWRPENYTGQQILKECGIKVSYACDVLQLDNFNYGSINIVNYREILKNSKEYFFIINMSSKYDINVAIKLLLLYHCDEFGIIYSAFTKDFEGIKELHKSFFDSYNEVYYPYSFLGNVDILENFRRNILEGAGYWDVPYVWIYKLFKKKKNIKYCEIGAGNGIMSISLKKLLDMEVTWIDLPESSNGHWESMWKEVKDETTKNIIKKYDIKTILGAIETDTFYGEWDIICLTQVMEHFVFNPVNSFIKLKNILKENGYIFVSVPEDIKHYNVDSYHDMPYPHEMTKEEQKRRIIINDFGHFHEYSYAEALDVFHEAGLECVFHKWTPPIHHFMLRKAILGKEPESGEICLLR